MIIWILLSLLYVAAGWLYSEAMWNNPEIQEGIEDLCSTMPPEAVRGPLAFVKLLVAIFWPLLFIWSLIMYFVDAIKVKLGLKEKSKEE